MNMKQHCFDKLLIPVKKIDSGKGFFRWPDKAVISSVQERDILPLQQLAGDLARNSVKAHFVRDVACPAELKIYRDRKIKNHQAYKISIGSGGIEIFAGADAGAYYAVQTIRDLIAIYGRSLPACVIKDEPDFNRRGVYHDCSRGKVPKLSTLKELVERLAHWKINELQLYVENVFTFKQHPDIGKGFSPFTPDEILKLQEHCKAHHVRLVGSLASFGHLENILSLPKYSHLGELPGFRGFPGGTTLCPGDAGSIKLISELYSEYIPLFEAEDFNVCCDETWELGKGRSLKHAEKIGQGKVYLDFVLKIYRLCQMHGKRMNMWADILLKYPEVLKELPKDIVLLNWEYEKGGDNTFRTKEIANAGMPFMVCPGTSSWLTHGTRLDNSMANVAEFSAQGRKYHAEGLLNTDWGDQRHRNFLGVSLHSFAHGAAHGWNGKAVDESRFTENFCYHTFGQKTKLMAKGLKVLGGTYVTCGKVCKNQSLLYRALVEPILPDVPTESSPMDMMTSSGLRRVVGQLSDAKYLPSYKSMDEFEQLAVKELALAAKMDCLSSEKALAAKTLRSGKEVKKAELNRLAREMHSISDDFKELWMLRNKKSRLQDNLQLFQKAQRELSMLADKY